MSDNGTWPPRPRTRGRSAEENQRYVRDQMMQREPRLVQALGALLRERGEHVRECPERGTRGRSR